jgi:hypothetical protein
LDSFHSILIHFQGGFEMIVTIEVESVCFTVRINGKLIGRWSYLDGALEAARKEILIFSPANLKE